MKRTSEVQLNVMSKRYLVSYSVKNEISFNRRRTVLKDTAKNFADERSPITHFRALRIIMIHFYGIKICGVNDQIRWPGILIPEEYGGSNFVTVSVILNECAKTLPSPLFATGVIGAYSITNYGTETERILSS